MLFCGVCIVNKYKVQSIKAVEGQTILTKPNLDTTTQ